MKALKYIVIHCTATLENQEVSKEDILRWHTSPKSKGGRGWKNPGYSDMIDLKGKLINIKPFNQDNKVDPWEITNGARGVNDVARHLVYVGGLEAKTRRPKDTRNQEQQRAMETYVKYMVLRHPEVKIIGHNQVKNSGKSCPCFDVAAWCKSIGISSKHTL